MDNGNETISTRIERADGLDCETALETARYLVVRSGGTVLPASKGFTLEVAADSPAVLDEIEHLADEIHGFSCERGADGLTICVGQSKPSDSPLERERLIARLGRIAAREALEGGGDYAAQDRAVEEEERWCATMTCHFLRDRLRALA